MSKKTWHIGDAFGVNYGIGIRPHQVGDMFGDTLCYNVMTQAIPKCVEMQNKIEFF